MQGMIDTTILILCQQCGKDTLHRLSATKVDGEIYACHAKCSVCAKSQYHKMKENILSHLLERFEK